jgi:hypothetical protein
MDKELCIKCHDKHRVKPWAKQPKKERNWSRGLFVCMAEPNRRTYNRTEGEIPSCCFYFLEQLLKSKEAKNE